MRERCWSASARDDSMRAAATADSARATWSCAPFTAVSAAPRANSSPEAPMRASAWPSKTSWPTSTRTASRSPSIQAFTGTMCCGRILPDTVTSPLLWSSAAPVLWMGAAGARFFQRSEKAPPPTPSAMAAMAASSHLPDKPAPGFLAVVFRCDATQVVPHAVAGGDHIGRQGPFTECVQVLVELFHSGSAQDDAIGRRVMQDPIERKIDQAAAGALRNGLQPVHRVEVSGMPVAIEVELVGVETRAGNRPLVAVLAGEQPARQRIVNHGGHLKRLAHGQIFLLDAARQQVVHGLRNVRGLVSLALGNPVDLHDLPGGVVGSRGVAHLAGAHQPVHGFERLFDGCIPIGCVQVIEVQVIGLQAAQA